MSGYDKILKVYGLTDDIKTWAPETGFQDRKEPYFVTHGVNMMEVRVLVCMFEWCCTGVRTDALRSMACRLTPLSFLPCTPTHTHTNIHR